MKKILFLILFILAAASFASAQDVTISREAAEKCLKDADKVAALEAENTTLKKGVDDLRVEVYKIQIEYARIVGEKTVLEKNAIQDKAELEQYRQYFFTKPKNNCKFAILCIQ